MLLVQRSDGGVLLERRPERGVWGGLWSPPQFPSIEAARLYADTRLTAAEVEPAARESMRHAFTHFDLDIMPLLARCTGIVGSMAGVMAGGIDGVATLWYNAAQPERVGLPAPVAQLIRSLS